MSSWAQQLEAIRRAAQGGVRARTNAQGSQRLPLANNRLREVLLSRPNGELTRAGQFYYGLVGGPLEAVRRGAAPHPRGPRTTSSSARGSRSPCAPCSPTAATTSPRPTRSSCATRGSATPSPTPAAWGSRCGAGCICATPPARTSLRPYPPSPWAKARNSAHGDQLRARGPRRADVEVLHRKMRVVRARPSRAA